MTKKLSDEEKAARAAAREAAKAAKTSAVAPAIEAAAERLPEPAVAASPIVPEVPPKNTHTVKIQGVHVATYSVESGATLGSVYTPDKGVILRDANGKEIAASTLIVADTVFTSAAKAHRG